MTTDSAKPWQEAASLGLQGINDSAKPWAKPTLLAGGDCARPWGLQGSAGTFNSLPPYRDLILGTQGLTHYWRLDEPSGTVAHDSVGSLNGTIQSGVALGVNGITADNAAMRFDGAQGKIAFTTPGLTGDFSIEGWIYVLGGGSVGLGDYACLIGADGTHRMLFHISDGQLLVQMGGGNLTAPAGSFVLEQWTHMVMTRTGNTQLLYIQGVQVGSLSQAGASLNVPWWIGAYSDPSTNYSLNGRADEIAMYNRVLTPDEIALHYAAGASSQTITGLSETDPRATNAPSALTITTPDSSGQVIEPSVEYVAAGFGGHKWWADITGYTNGNNAFENPAIYYSDDGLNFTPAPGVPFPLQAKPAVGNNDDPEIRMGPDGVMHTIFCEDDNPSGTHKIYWSSSSDGGVTWAIPTVILTTSPESHAGPVILYDADNNRWVMWYTDGHNTAAPYVYRRRTCPGTSPGGTWSSPVDTTLLGVPAGRSIFESHVEYYGQQIHMVTTLCDQGTGGGNTKLHFGVSNDHGLTWHINPNPLLDKSGGSGWDSGMVYRGDFGPPISPGHLYSLWYSARNGSGQWHWGHTFIDLA